jgi:hypothetical protein
MNRKPILACIVSAVALAGYGTILVAADASPDGKAAFARLKALVGDWEGPGPVPNGPPAKAEFHLAGNGSALEERLFPGTPHEMITMYYLDGNDLVLTHYCAGANQPHMKLVSGGADGELRFDFAGGTNVDLHTGSHMHTAAFKKLSADHYEAEWAVMKDGKVEGGHAFQMTRVVPAAK